MTADAEAARSVRTIHQKLDAEGKLLPIWSWRLQQGNGNAAFGERGSKQEAMSAADRP
jgi:hypothetical protein